MITPSAVIMALLKLNSPCSTHLEPCKAPGRSACHTWIPHCRAVVLSKYHISATEPHPSSPDGRQPDWCEAHSQRTRTLLYLFMLTMASTGVIVLLVILSVVIIIVVLYAALPLVFPRRRRRAWNRHSSPKLPTSVPVTECRSGKFSNSIDVHSILVIPRLFGRELRNMFDNIRATSDFPTASLAPLISTQRDARATGSSIAAPCLGGPDAGGEDSEGERGSLPAATTSCPSRESAASIWNNKRTAKVIYEQHVLLQVFKADSRLEKKMNHLGLILIVQET